MVSLGLLKQPGSINVLIFQMRQLRPVERLPLAQNQRAVVANPGLKLRSLDLKIHALFILLPSLPRIELLGYLMSIIKKPQSQTKPKQNQPHRKLDLKQRFYSTDEMYTLHL